MQMSHAQIKKQGEGGSQILAAESYLPQASFDESPTLFLQ